jgi:outer membrane lipoprotein SlyB
MRKGDPTGGGAVGGALVGGVIGSSSAMGPAAPALSVLDALGGGLAGNTIEKNVKKTTLWITEVTFRDGASETYEAKVDPHLDEGDVVRIEHGEPVKHGE